MKSLVFFLFLFSLSPQIEGNLKDFLKKWLKNGQKIGLTKMSQEWVKVVQFLDKEKFLQ